MFGDLERAIEAQMLQKADAMIDEAIPAEGLDTFGDPSGRPGASALFGLGEMDLDVMGTNAFAGILGAIDLDVMGSGSFNGMGSLGALGAWGFSKFRAKIRGLVRGKANIAKRALGRVASQHKQMVGRARGLFKKARYMSNPFQKARALNLAKSAADKAGILKSAAVGLAKQAVNPKISRGEARVAMRPVVKEMAKVVAKPAEKIIQQTGKIVATVPGAAEAVAEAKKTGEFKEQMKAAMDTAIAKQIPPAPPAAQPSAKKLFWMKRFKGMKVMPKWVQDMKGLGDVYSQMVSEAQAEGMYFPSSGMTSEIGDGGGQVSGFLSMGDMETVEQPVDAIDITRDWATDEMFGEPLGI